MTTQHDLTRRPGRSWKGRVVFAFLLCLLLVAFAVTRTRDSGQSQDRFNLLVISVDTLRADHLGCYGYDRPTSPAIDSLASESTIFSRLFAQRGETWPSLASIMTSVYPHTHGVRSNGIKMLDSQPTLASVLRERGYKTAAALANAPQQNWHGFDAVHYLKGQDLTVAAVMGIEAASQDNFFFWLHYVAPHRPYIPPGEFATRFDPGYSGDVTGEEDCLNEITKSRRPLSLEDLNHIHALYDGEIAFIDNEIRQVLATLEEAGLAEDTIVVITSDHGEDLYEHNLYFGHSASVYDSTLHIPFVLHVPGRQYADQVDTITESIDIAPTLLELMGVKAPEAFEGTSLVPLMEGRELDLGPAFAEWQDKMVTIRTDTHKYILNPLEYHPFWLIGDPGERYFIDKEELYDIRRDPVEAENLAAEEQEIRSQLRTLVEDWIQQHGWKLDEFRGEKPEIEPAIKESLEALGYV